MITVTLNYLGFVAYNKSCPFQRSMTNCLKRQHQFRVLSQNCEILKYVKG